MYKILMGGLIAICLFAFNVSESKAQTNPGTNCRLDGKGCRLFGENSWGTTSRSEDSR